MQWVAANGQYGVTMFFVVSGYLITSNIIRRNGSLGDVKIVDFYIMRVGRILPGLLLLVGLLLALSATGPAAFIPPDDRSVWDAAWHVLTFRYFNLVYVNFVPGMIAWGPTWSLSVEEIFYAVLPATCMLLRRREIISIALAVLVALGPYWRARYGYLTVSGSSDALALGCLVAIWCPDVPVIAGRCLRYASATVVAGAFIFSNVANATGTTYVISLVVLAAALYICGSRTTEARPDDPLQFMGRSSYELYLFHTPILLVCAPLSAIAPFAATFMLTGALSVMAATAISHFYTEPANVRIRMILPTLLRSRRTEHQIT